MNKCSPFEDYLKWDRENVIHLESTVRIIEHPSIRIVDNRRTEEQKLVKNKIKSSHCPYCGAPINPYKIKCEYCGCYYEVN